MHCICCNSEDIKSLGKLKSYDYYKCNNCEFRFISPVPSQEELTAFYNTSRVSSDLKETVKSLISAFDASTNPKKDWFHLVLNKVKKIKAADKLNILEIGSGYGYFVHEMTNIGQQIIGTESTKEYANAINGVINGKIEYVEQPLNKHFDLNSFDFIYLEHVFEHVLNPEIILREIYEVLKKDGVLVMSVPNTNSLSSKIFGKRWAWATPPDHLFYYNLKSLTSIIEKHGFHVVDSSIGDYYFRSVYQMYSLMPIINFIRKRLGKKPKSNPYTYPNSLFSIFVLLPYWFAYPILKLMKQSGNELTVYCVKAKN